MSYSGRGLSSLPPHKPSLQGSLSPFTVVSGFSGILFCLVCRLEAPFAVLHRHLHGLSPHMAVPWRVGGLERRPLTLSTWREAQSSPLPTGISPSEQRLCCPSACPGLLSSKQKESTFAFPSLRNLSCGFGAAHGTPVRATAAALRPRVRAVPARCVCAFV